MSTIVPKADQILKELEIAIRPAVAAFSIEINVSALKIHSAVEELLGIILKLTVYSGDMEKLNQKNPVYESVFSDMGFGRKMDVLNKNKIISAEAYESLKYLNTFRVRNAHPKKGPTDSDLDFERLHRLLELLQADLVSVIKGKTGGV